MSRLAVLTAILILTIPAAAQTTYDWSMVGTTGEIDPASAAHAHAGPTLQFAAAATGTIVSRYPVTNTYGAGTPSWMYLILSYANNSASGSVSARLLRVEHCSGVEEQMCRVNGTNTLGNSTCGYCLFNPGELDFTQNSYYIEVTLTRSVTSATPRVHTVALGN